MSTTGYLRQDQDSHWYFVPEEFIKNFDSLNQQIEEEKTDWINKDYLLDVFTETFGEFRLNSPVETLRIAIE